MRSSTRAALLAIAVVWTPAAVQAQTPVRPLGLDTAGFDRSVRPQDDFDRFVNGRWRDRTEIPGDRPAWGSFYEVVDRTDATLKTVAEEAAAAHARSGARQKVGDFLASYLDSLTIEERGIEPLAGELAAIAAIESHADLPAALARLQLIGVNGVMGAGVTQDPKNSSRWIVTVGQIDVPLGDRSFYLADTDAFTKIRAAYVEYLTRLFTLAQQPDPAGAAARVLAFETEVARVQWDRARNRDRDATYNPMSVAKLAQLTPSYSWPAHLEAEGMRVERVVVRQPDYLREVDRIVASTPISTWKEFLTGRLLDAYANELPAAFAEARFELRGRVLAGQTARPERWRRGVAEVDNNVGEALGQLYVAKAFPPEAKARIDALIKNLLAAFEAGIDELEWMSPATKQAAQAKLAQFGVKIAYPGRFKDYADVDVRRDDLLGNVLRAKAAASRENIARLDKPVDRGEWGMTPQTVNAGYFPPNNEIVFPAAILQPPFFDPNRDDAVNYGAIGAVIGHEISHGFDDQGRKSDGEGNLIDWWTPGDAAAFQERADRLAAQFDAYTPIDTMHVHGKQTLGENIGDLSGLAVAYRAYRLSLGDEEAPLIAGFTGDQRFFLGWSQVWRMKTRPERRRQQLLTDVHAPEEIRAYAPFTNFDPFYRAFDVQPGDRMYRAPADRVKIW